MPCTSKRLLYEVLRESLCCLAEEDREKQHYCLNYVG